MCLPVGEEALDGDFALRRVHDSTWDADRCMGRSNQNAQVITSRPATLSVPILGAWGESRDHPCSSSIQQTPQTAELSDPRPRLRLARTLLCEASLTKRAFLSLPAS